MRAKFQIPNPKGRRYAPSLRRGRISVFERGELSDVSQASKPAQRDDAPQKKADLEACDAFACLFSKNEMRPVGVRMRAGVRKRGFVFVILQFGIWDFAQRVSCVPFGCDCAALRYFA